MLRSIAPDVVVLLGTLAFLNGVRLISPAAGWVVGGLVAAGIGILLALREARAKRGSP